MYAKRRHPHFLEAFLPNLSSERLKIPDNFVKHLEGRTYGSVSLEGPSGNVWCVKLRKYYGELFFEDGWPTFVKDHTLQCGDSLVFRYDGDLHFVVQVYDQTSCEKEEVFLVKCSERPYECDRNTGMKREREKIASLANLIADDSRKKLRGVSSPGILDCKIANQTNGTPTDGHGQLSLCSTIKDKVSMASKKAVVMVMTSRDDADRKEGIPRGSLKRKVKNNFSISAFLEKQATQHFTSSFPYFVRVMKASNVSGSGTLKLPVQFSMQHLPKGRATVILKNTKGGCWTLSSVPTVRTHIMHTLCGGWTGFVRDNGIKLEDICIFELVGSCEMRVHVLRLGVDFEGLKGACVNSAFCVSRPTKSKDASYKQEAMMNNINSSLPGTAISADGSSPSREVFLQIHSHEINGLGSHAGATSTTESSAFPSFTKVMRYSNISGPYTLNVPSKFAVPHFPNYRTEILLRNTDGKIWTVNSLPSSNRCTAHTFCGGWMAFVRGNDLRIGDTCVFELVGKEELLVRVLRKGVTEGHPNESTVDVGSSRYTTSDELPCLT